MNISIAAFTEAGARLADKLADALEDRGHLVTEVGVLMAGEPMAESLHSWTERAFAGDAVLFVGACGIAVRAVAPFVRDKLTDPAVVSVDEQGRFAVPLLSGHVGGANKLAAQVAEATGGVPVISTATDLSGKFAVDVWAKKNRVCLCERELAKAVSAALLAGRTVGFSSDFPCGGLPEGLVDGTARELGICVSLDGGKSPFARTLHAVPKIVTVGVGCRKGTPTAQFERALLDALEAHGISIHAVSGLATIDLKQVEPCIQEFCQKYQMPFQIASAQQLQAVEGDFSSSGFVERTVGVDNVCERAAALFSGGGLLFGKTSRDGVTVAAAISNWRPGFEDKNGRD